jgi:hypothetical protein
MSATSIPHADARTFKVWEYQVSHAQLLIRSPKSPATPTSQEWTTNVDIVCLDVEYMALPRDLPGLQLVSATSEDLQQLASILGKMPEANTVTILLSGGRRFPIVAFRVSISENDWDIFESPFEFRSQFRGAGAPK